MKIIQMIIEKHYNKMLRISPCDYLKAHLNIFLAACYTWSFKTKIFLLNKMNTDIKQGSQDHPNESSYPIATVIDKGLYEIYNSPIYRRIYKSSKFVYNVRKSD